MSIIDFSTLNSRKEAKAQQAEAYPYDTYFPESVSFIGEPWTTLAKHIGHIEQGAVINFWTFGRYAMHDLISHICRQIGPCNVTACTWAITEKAVTQLLNRRKDGLIKDFRLWNKYDPVDRDFLEGWFLDWLMREISDPSTSDNARAKNLATLQKFLSQLPPQKIDPKLMESNQIYVQFNINNKQVKIPETVLMKLPADIRRQLLGSLDDEITEETACEIINS